MSSVRSATYLSERSFLPVHPSPRRAGKRRDDSGSGHPPRNRNRDEANLVEPWFSSRTIPAQRPRSRRNPALLGLFRDAKSRRINGRSRLGFYGMEEVKGSNPFRSTNLPIFSIVCGHFNWFVGCLVPFSTDLRMVRRAPERLRKMVL